LAWTGRKPTLGTGLPSFHRSCTREQPIIDFRQHLELETPEQVTLDYEIAGPGTRILAALVDWAILVVVLITVFIALSIARRISGWAAALILLIMFIVFVGYFALFEGFNRGQTPGKRRVGVRVIRDTGHGIGFGEAAARALLLPADMGLGMIGLVMIGLDPKARRLGDWVAGTVVVRDRPVEAATAAPVPPAAADLPARGLDDREFHLLRGYVERAASLPPAVRERFAAQLAARFLAGTVTRPLGDAELLAGLFAVESARRAGASGARSPRSFAERMAARKRERWNEFYIMAQRVSQSGLDTLSAVELPEFAARYREVAADLARARTYRADAVMLTRLERLTAAGHSALYQAPARTWRRIWIFLSRECPAAVLHARRYVALAFAVFALPALAGYAVLRERPDLAPSLLPDVMLERGEAGHARTTAGQGYVVESAGARPMMATSIISNNVRVAFNCFASGIVLGVGSLVALAFNGLQIGAASGYFANQGLLGYLWTFIIGHGALELFAIWVAGAAGFLLGKAVIAPGELPRADALTLAGRQAMRMLGLVLVLLIVAGSIEGFISSSGASVPVRAAVSVTSVVFLLLYLGNGARAVSDPS
jgi:uncharacterized membrane protein SpoIIM required for sporulation/uncharacterized RDD family membrane protein YckC